jgi:hypothetical protein
MLFAVLPLKTTAQLPTASSSADPVWYYIQVQGGSDGRSNLVFTADNDGVRVFGKSVLLSGNASEIDKQLWRFEQNGSNYTIFNKATGKKLTTSFNSSKGISVATLNATASTTWQFINNSNYFNLKASAAPSGGNASAIYTHQANNYDSRNFVIMLESSTYNNTENSRFRFVLYQDFEIELSDEDKSVWYIISNAKPGYQNKGITDIVDRGNPNVKFSLEELTSGNKNQQWKAVKKNADTNDKRVNFINRETGRIIRTHSVFNDPFNFIQFTENQNESNGWTTRYLGEGQFEVFGMENDGVTRYLNASSMAANQSDLYIEDASKDTGFAWQFTKANLSGLNPISSENNHIYVKDKQIFVDGTDNYTIRTVHGIAAVQNKPLPTGIYFVTVNGKTTKILIH